MGFPIVSPKIHSAGVLSDHSIMVNGSRDIARVADAAVARACNAARIQDDAAFEGIILEHLKECGAIGFIMKNLHLPDPMTFEMFFETEIDSVMFKLAHF